MGKYSTKTERRLGRRPSNKPRNQRGPEHPKNSGGKTALVAKSNKVRQQKAGRKTNTKSGPGKGPEKKTPSGAQPANPGGKNCITLNLSDGTKTLAKSLVKCLGHKRAKHLSEVLTMVLNNRTGYGVRPTPIEGGEYQKRTDD